MTRLSHILLIAVSVLVLLSGCSDYDSSTHSTFGQLTLTVTADAVLKSPAGETLADINVAKPNDVTVTMSDEQGSYTRRWESLSDFPAGERYFVGTYSISAGFGNKLTEGFDNPYYYGETLAQISDGSTTDAGVTLDLISSVAAVTFTPQMVSAFSSLSARINSEAGGYFDFAAGENRLLYIQPGQVKLYLTLVLPDGRQVSFLAATVARTQSCVLYDFKVDVSNAGSDPVVSVTVGDEETVTVLTDEFISQASPVIRTSGWSDGGELLLPEGDAPSVPVIATVESAAGFGHLYLSANSASLREDGMPSQVDLLHLTAEQASELNELGLKTTVTDGEIKVDFTTLLSNLVFLTAENALSTFTLVAENVSGKSCEPVTLKVRTTPVEIEILSVDKAIVGINKGSIRVRSSAPGFSQHVEIEYEKEPDSDEWQKVSGSDIASVEESVYIVSFPLPDGSGPVNVRVLYCDEVRANVTVERFMPDFSIEVDAYANFGVVKIVAADESMLGTITDNVTIYANGQKGSVLSRYPDKGLLSIIGLKPSTTYRFRATMMSAPGNNDFTKEVIVKTEGTPQLPNGDFEERNDGIKYKDLPSGGRYSQTMVEIFNWQNHTSYDQQVPKGWANTNAKTFCRAAKNHNTWYMQPSVFTVDDVQSGDFAVSLRSVAYDIDGEPILDYAQTGEPYLDYSLNIPRIAGKAAGKLFLGDYSFDAAGGTETYREGISWNSRPVSLNGFYKYAPSEDNWNDRGLVLVEVIGERDGKEVVIASGRRILPLATGYTAFNVPLEYESFGVKATRIKVMFSSTESIGTIAEETSIVTTHPDSRTATSLGSQLWLDNVTLAY